MLGAPKVTWYAPTTRAMKNIFSVMFISNIKIVVRHCLDSLRPLFQPFCCVPTFIPIFMESQGSTHVNPSVGKSTIADPLSPSFLHHSGSFGLKLVSQSLTGDNYASWSRAMTIALSVQNKLGFIDGSIEKPDDIDLNLLNSWIWNNNLVISWMLNSVSKEISIIYSKLASKIWLDLQDIFQ